MSDSERIARAKDESMVSNAAALHLACTGQHQLPCYDDMHIRYSFVPATTRLSRFQVTRTHHNVSERLSGVYQLSSNRRQVKHTIAAGNSVAGQWDLVEPDPAGS